MAAYQNGSAPASLSADVGASNKSSFEKGKDKLLGLFARSTGNLSNLPDAVANEVRHQLSQRRQQISFWLFLVRTLVVLGLGILLTVEYATGNIGWSWWAFSLLSVYLATNAGLWVGLERNSKLLPWLYVALDTAFILTMRFGFEFAAVYDPNLTLVGLFTLLLICYSSYGNPSLSAALALGAIAVSGFALFQFPYAPAEATSTIGSTETFRLFLTVQYLSIACIVTCLIAIQLREKIIAHSSEWYRRMKSAIETAAERARREEFEALNKLKEDFMTVLSHELRNPIAPLCSSLQIIKEELEEDEDQELVEVAIDSARSIQRLVEDYTRLAWLFTRDDAEHCTRRNVALPDLLDAISSKFDGKRIECHGSTQSVASADPYLLQGAVLAVLRRAVSQTPPDKSVVVKIGREGGYAAFSVHDPNSYLTEQEIDDLDDPFSATSERVYFSEGTGLELILAQHAIKQMDGHLQVSSSEIDGTTVRLLFPEGSDDFTDIDRKQLRDMLGTEFDPSVALSPQMST